MKKSVLLVACVIGLLLLSLLAQAVTVKATYKRKVATWQVPLTADSSYSLTNPVVLKAGKTVFGTIEQLSLTSFGDPFLTLNFKIHADTTADFTFDTGTLNFDALVNPQAFATAAATITADRDGGTLKGNFGGTKAYRATYNDGMVFADLIDPFGTVGNTSNARSDRFPGGTGFTVINDTVSSMRAQWDFNLTEGDEASGTSRWEIIPGEQPPPPIPDASTIVLAFLGALPMAITVFGRRRASV